MLHLWDAIEADFRREYGIVLMEQIDGMSWRQFANLVRNLSPYGAVAARAAEGRAPENKTENGSRAEAFFAACRR